MSHSQRVPPVSQAFLQSLSEQLALGFALDRYAAVEHSIRDKVRSGRFPSLDAYRAALASDRQLRHDLIETIVVPETHFFRHPQHFAFLRDRVLPDLAGKGRAIRLWSAGCSTGEEPYSLAILVHQLGLANRAEIIATDVSRGALDKARRGLYRSWSLRGIGEWPGASRYFDRTAPGEYRLQRQIRDLVRFAEANLTDPLLSASGSCLAQMDVILCRNVLIYMTAETTAKIARRLSEMLAPGGWLVPGPSDPLAGHKSLCRPAITPQGIFYQRRDGDAALGPTVLAAGRAAPSLGGDAPQPQQPLPAAGLVPAVPERVALPLPTRRRPRKAAPEPLPRRLPARRPLVQEVSRLVNAGRCEEAWQAVGDAMARDPLSTEVHYLAALVHWHRRALDDALACLRKAIYLNPGCAVAHHLRGVLLVQKGQLDPARRAFRWAYQLAKRLPGDAAVEFGEGETAAGLAQAAQSQLRSLQAVGGAK